MAPKLQNVAAAALLSLIACTSCCEALNVPTPRRFVFSARMHSKSMPSHQRLQMTNNNDDDPSYYKYTTSDDDESFYFDSRYNNGGGRSSQSQVISKLAQTNTNNAYTDTSIHQRQMRQLPLQNFQSRAQEMQQKQNNLPLEDLLSDGRRQALQSDMESMTHEASVREERIRVKLMELGRSRQSQSSSSSSSLGNDIGRENNHFDVADSSASDSYYYTPATMASSSSPNANVANNNNGLNRGIFTNCIVPAAASVASLGGLAVFRDGMIRREQKEAEVRRDKREQLQLSAQKREMAKRRENSGMLGGMMSGAAASLGAFVVSVGAQAAPLPESVDFELRKDPATASSSSSQYIASENIGGNLGWYHDSNFVAPMGVGKAYAFDAVDDRVKDQSTTTVASTTTNDGEKNAMPAVPTSGFSSGIDYSDASGSGSSPSGNVATPGGNRLNVKLDSPKRVESTSKPLPVTFEPKVMMELDSPKRQATSSKPPPVTFEPKVMMEKSTLPTRPSGTSGSGAATNSPPPGSVAIPGGMYVKLDNGAKREATSSTKPAPPPEPKVIIDQSTIKLYRKVPLPRDLGVVMEESPQQRRSTVSSPPPEMKVKLEKSIPKRVDPPQQAGTEELSTQKTTAPPPASVAAIASSTYASVPETKTPPPASNNVAKAPSPPESKVEVVKERGGEDARKKTERESIRPDTLDYIKAYNSQNGAQKGKTDATGTKASSTKEKTDTRSSKNSHAFRATISTSANAISEALDNAKVFSVGVGVGAVALITRQKRRESSSDAAVDYSYSSSTADAPPDPPIDDNTIDVDTDEYPRMSQRSYLDSISVVSSVGRGQQSYLDGLPGSSSMELDYHDLADDAAELYQETAELYQEAASLYQEAVSLTSFNEENIADGPSSPIIDESMAETRGNSYLESLDAGASSKASEESGSSYLSSLTRAPPLSVDNLP